MKDTIKPIETIYNGYKFRSRLESRWAVFFDAAGIRYEYEPEGFKSKNGFCYLPDFYLPNEDIYVEVKAPRYEKWEEMYKALSFVGDKIKCLMVLTNIPSGETPIVLFPAIYYNPVIKDLTVIHCPFVYGLNGPWVSIDGRCPKTNPMDDNSLWFEDWEYAYQEGEPIELEKYELATEPRGDNSMNDLMDYYYGGNLRKFAPIVSACFRKARQSRFEHGVKG